MRKLITSTIFFETDDFLNELSKLRVNNFAIKIYYLDMKYIQTIIVTLGKKHPNSLKYLSFSLKEILSSSTNQLIFIYRKDFKEYQEYIDLLKQYKNVVLLETKDNECKKICKINLAIEHIKGKYVRFFDPDDLYIRNESQEEEIKNSHEDILIERILFFDNFVFKRKKIWFGSPDILFKKELFKKEYEKDFLLMEDIYRFSNHLKDIKSYKILNNTSYFYLRDKNHSISSIDGNNVNKKIEVFLEILNNILSTIDFDEYNFFYYFLLFRAFNYIQSFNMNNIKLKLSNTSNIINYLKDY
jgi:hypothetical protein